MIVGVPREIKEYEYRVGIVPAGVRVLAEHGHKVLIEAGAGEGCRISDAEFQDAGAVIIASAADLYGEAEMIMKVKEPQKSEWDLLREGQILYAYLHLAPAAEMTNAMLKKRIIGVAYETIQLADGSLPLLMPMSEVAGRMAVQVGAHFLEKTQGGRGVLLGGVPGVSRGRVTILGAGTVGTAAAKIAVGLGAEVQLIDVNQSRLFYLDDIFGSRVSTKMSNKDNVYEAVRNSHLVIGAVLIPGATAPTLVTAETVKAMKAGTVIVDVAIDQGGCVETSRVTTHKAPVHVQDEVIHYGVPNMPSVVARTSTFALSNVTLPYAVKLADLGLHAAVKSDTSLANGVNVCLGRVTYLSVAESLGHSYTPLTDVINSSD